MEFANLNLLLPLISIIIILFFMFLKTLIKHNDQEDMPPSPPSMPILGHLHLLLSIKGPFHQHLQALSAQYGSTLLLRIGSRSVLLLSSTTAVENCFTENDIVFANRPDSLAFTITGYNGSIIGASPYGDHWRNLRRVAAINIFSAACIRRSAAVRNSEVRLMVRTLFQTADPNRKVKVNLNAMFSKLALRVAGMMAAGKSCETVGDIFLPTGLLSVCDFMPVLRWIGYKGIERKLKEVHKKRDGFLQGLIDGFRRDKSGLSPEKDVNSRKTVLEVLMGLQAAEPDVYTDIIVKGMMMLMFTAGMDTSIKTMEWAMALLLNHPKILAKARAEIDACVNAGQLIDDSDVPKLTYLRCIINETLRLFPVAPLLLPHCSSEDCVVSGYKVPKETILIVNAWAIQRDGSVWEEPNKFRPERFEGFEGERDGYKFIPFGVGRRSCPGAALGTRFVGLSLGAMIQCLDWETVGSGGEDLSEGMGGITLPKGKPLEAMYSPRDSMTSVLSHLLS
ncbi:unnamed protein product [Rhodiola kirilowii]